MRANARLPFVAPLLLAALLVGSGAWSAAARTPTVPAADPVCAAAPAPGGAATAEAGAAFAGGLPDGVAIRLLASAVADALPTAPAKLRLTRVALRSGAGSQPRLAKGPLLFAVETGTVSLYRTGERTRLGPGEMGLVRLDQIYSLINDGGEPAAVLKLALTPPAVTDIPVGDDIDLRDLAPPTPPTGPPTDAELLRGAVDPLPSDRVRLFLGCVEMTDPGADLGLVRFPGPVGLRVERGGLRVGELIALGPGNCTLFQFRAPYRLVTGEDATTLLLFGATLDGEPLWQPVPANDPAPPSAPPSELRCGATP